MTKKFMKSVIPVIVILSIVMAGCAPQAAPTEAPAEAAVEATEAPAEVVEEATEAPEEAMPAIDPTGQTITFWHVWGTGLPSETLAGIVDEFNAGNEWGITVDAQDQGRYNDLEDAFNVAIQSGDIPDIVTGYTNAMANWYAVDSIVDLTPFMTDAYFGLTADDTAAIYEGTIDGGKSADGIQFGFPISQSANVLFYNAQWAQELGFDAAPASFAEFKEQACAAAEANNTDDDPDNDGTGGLVLDTGASNVASWVYANGGNMLNAAGDGYDYTAPTVVDVANFYKEMWDEKCAFQTESYPNPEFASRKALYTTSSTAGLPYQVAAFEAEGAIQDEWTIIPFPGKDGGQAVDLYGQYVGIANTNPERQMASWVFLQYLTSPEVQAKWIQGSAYYPTRSDTIPMVDAYSQENLIWSTGLTFLEYGSAEPAWASWSQVRRDVETSFAGILQGTVEDIPAALETLNATAAEAIAELQ
ncbi:MAG: extracellular solute-binding protein [Anaerolineaceae bacterium]|nr:extracellular solute-binding protein [Anaerolineaceae bacterium]